MSGREAISSPINGNLTSRVSSEAIEALADLRAFVVPVQPPGGSVGDLFARLRLAVLADAAIARTARRRNPRLRREVIAGATALGQARCMGAVDFAAKAIMTRALVATSASFAASRHDPSALISDVEMLADLIVAVAADALAIAGYGVRS